MDYALRAKVVETLDNQMLPLLQTMRDEYYKKNYTNLTPELITISYGNKYAKFIKRYAGDTYGCVYFFVNLENGDILKAASWAAPAKHARGNIFTSPNYGVGNVVGVYGATYLR